MMNKPKKILIAVVIAIGLLIVLPFFVPMQTYLRQAEKLASAELGVPVQIDSAHLALLPSPRVTVSDIVVGKHEEVKLPNLVVIPSFSSLFSDNKTLDVSLSKPVIKKSALEIVSAYLANKPKDNKHAAINVRHVEVDELQLLWPDAKFPAINVKATLEANQLKSAKLETVDSKLTAEVTPDGDQQQIVVLANKWTLPVGLPLLIDNAKLEMRLKGNQLTVPNINIALYGGKIIGAANMSWQNRWRLNGKLNIANLAVKQPSRMLSKSVYLGGNLFGNGNFSSTAKQAGNLSDNLQTNIKFKVNNGVLYGLDLMKIASLLVKQKQGGGETQFDEFSGVLNGAGKQYHLRNLKISSGLLLASGQVKIKPNKTLDGKIAVDVKKSMGLAEIPLDVSGTVSNPVVLPNKAALAGAIAGTAILGPAGTGLGMKAGGAVDKLKGLFD